MKIKTRRMSAEQHGRLNEFLRTGQGSIVLLYWEGDEIELDLESASLGELTFEQRYNPDRDVRNYVTEELRRRRME